MYKKIASSIIILFLFIYITSLICAIPSNYTFSSYPGILIIKAANEVFVSVISFNLGKSSDVVLQMWKSSLILLSFGLTLSIFIGILKGAFDSRKGTQQGSNARVLLTLIPISLPDALIIALLQQFVIFLNSKGLEFLKISGTGGMSTLVLPAIALSILPACYIARMATISIEACYNNEYYFTALGKGCSERRTFWNHIMPNVVPEIISGLPTVTSIIISNMLIVEYLFSYKGITYALFNSIKNGDVTASATIIVLIGITYFALNLLFTVMRFGTKKPQMEAVV